jgi:glycosyltransferase involved in cell wall biosynthesis
MGLTRFLRKYLVQCYVEVILTVTLRRIGVTPMTEHKTIDATKNTRKRVLLLVYACSPYRGSEQGLGWHRVIETAKYFDTWVICKKEKNEEDIKRYFKLNGNIPGLHFYFIPRTPLERLLKRLPIQHLWYFPYNLWHRRATRLAAELHSKFSFDLCHQVNMSGFREPGYLWRLNIPFIWGPVGGSENAPWRLITLSGFKGAIMEGSRNLINSLHLKYSLRVQKAIRKASIILVANSDGKHKFSRIHGIDPVLLSNNGIQSVPIAEAKTRSAETSIKILWSGRLTYNKCLPFLLRALAKMPATFDYSLRILGDGPQAKQWRYLSDQLGIERHCQWMGSLPHDQAIRQYEWADLFVFTSLRDTMATVVLEALTYGVPVICLDHSGAHDVVTDGCGITIPPTTPKEVILRLRNAIIRAADDRTQLALMSRGAIERARKFLWSENGKQMAELYNKLLTSQI